MPKRNRAKEQRALYGPASAPAPAVESEQARAARLFADSIRAHEVADRAAAQRKRDEAEHSARLDTLRTAKQAAANRIKRLRAESAIRPRILEAEAEYRVALAELTEFETGERPHWAPPPAIAATAEEGDDGADGDRDETADTSDVPEATG